MIEIGSTLNGRYKILGMIGSGGMANVYLAEDLILDREVAVKVLRFDFQNDAAAIRRFQREARAASELVHPNIVSVYDVGEEDGLQYIVMEYVDGMDLKRYLQTHYPLPYDEVVDIMEQIISAVEEAHAHQIIHRDIKPQNILIDKNGVVKITDFGIAVALTETSITQTNTMLGSVHYLSPEQARGGSATPQSDIYSMGIVLYELLTGSVPFDGETAVSIALKHFQADMPSVRDIDPNIPQPLENVILHATAKDPKDRYPSVSAMGADLRTALDPARADEPKFIPASQLEKTRPIAAVKDEPAAEEAPPEDTAKKPQEKAKAKQKWYKKKWVWALIAALLLLVAGGTVYAFSRNDVIVPDVSDMSTAQAKTILEEKNFKVADKTKEIKDEKIASGKVVKTSPEAGNKVKKGRTVTLYVSIGAGEVKMEDYVGKDFDRAKEALIALGFKEENIIQKTTYDPSTKNGNITKQSPAAGKKVDPAKQKVTFTVSKGSEPVTLKDYTGMSLTEVKSALYSLGLSDDQIVVTQIESSEAANTVVSQAPVGGTTIDPSSQTVTLTVSKGPTKVSLTDISGYTKAEADKYFKDNGLVPNYTEEYSDSVAEGKVIRTSPAKGESVAAGSTVQVVLSKGKEAKSSSTSSSSSSGTYTGSIVVTMKDPGTYSAYLTYADGTKSEVKTQDLTDASPKFTATFSVKKGQEAVATVEWNGVTVAGGTITESSPTFDVAKSAGLPNQ
ncbi:Stk1 family PASTA domain-containing Ser/Thr kinase [Enterococcus hirae]|nr:Stk1 family PASTA domain-containing Ser/Thr kinase [Enterococcus hirae]